MTGELDDRERRELRRKARAATLAALRSLGGEARRDAIRRRALADGGFTRRELAAPALAGAGARHARLVELHLAWALQDLRRQGAVRRVRWSVWRLATPGERRRQRSGLCRLLGA